ncbi:hypothetical protein BGZ93_004413, partial [Podila epicladia]
NIIRTKEDVARLWPGCDRAEDIQILGLDLGQTCVVGASALLPDGNTEIPVTTSPPSTATSTSLTSDTNAIATASISAPASVAWTVSESTQVSVPIPALATSIFHNLVAKQKAVYQSTLKLRRWTEEQKRIVAPGTEKSISTIECRLPALRGEDRSIYNYVKDLELVQDRLETFYNGDYKRHAWDAKKALEAEFAVITNRLLKIVGGSI